MKLLVLTVLLLLSSFKREKGCVEIDVIVLVDEIQPLNKIKHEIK